MSRATVTLVGLSVAQITSKLELSQGIRSCVRKNACMELGRRITAQPENAPRSLQYITQLLYGTSLILKISDAKVITNSNLVGRYGPYGGEVSFKLDQEHVQIQSSFFGAVQSLANLQSVDAYFKTHSYDVPELIGEAVVTMEFAGASEDLARICHAHPTLSEVVHEAALAVDKRPLHF